MGDSLELGGGIYQKIDLSSNLGKDLRIYPLLPIKESLIGILDED
jgi:hypothetical protein